MEKQSQRCEAVDALAVVLSRTWPRMQRRTQRALRLVCRHLRGAVDQGVKRVEVAPRGSRPCNRQRLVSSLAAASTAWPNCEALHIVVRQQDQARLSASILPDLSTPARFWSWHAWAVLKAPSMLPACLASLVLACPTLSQRQLNGLVARTSTTLRGLRLKLGTCQADVSALVACTSLQRLSLAVACGGARGLAGLTRCPNLQALELDLFPATYGKPLLDHKPEWGFPRCSDLLPRLTALSKLRLGSAAFCVLPDSQLSALARCTRLQLLDLGHEHDAATAADLTHLSACTRLRRLCLRGRLVTDLAPVAAFSLLTCLELTIMPAPDGQHAPPSLAPLSGCTRLRHLTISGTDGGAFGDGGATLLDLGPLRPLSLLLSLDVSSHLHLFNLRPLAALGGLTSLDLSDCGVEDVSPLSCITALQALDISGCADVSDLSALAACVDLRTLDISGCDLVGSVHPLARCTRLRVLRMAGCAWVQTLGPLSALGALRRLDISHCTRVQSVGPLMSCSSLRMLIMHGVSAQDIASLSQLGRQLAVWGVGSVQQPNSCIRANLFG